MATLTLKKKNPLTDEERKRLIKYLEESIKEDRKFSKKPEKNTTL